MLIYLVNISLINWPIRRNLLSNYDNLFSHWLLLLPIYSENFLISWVSVLILWTLIHFYTGYVYFALFCLAFLFISVFSRLKNLFISPKYITILSSVSLSNTLLICFIIFSGIILNYSNVWIWFPALWYHMDHLWGIWGFL